MSISSYKDKNGKTLWKVHVGPRSKINPTIRVQRTEQGIESKGKAERREKELLEICIREVMQKEGILPTWGVIVSQWDSYRRSIGDIQEDTIDDYFYALKEWTKPIWEKICNEIHKGDIRSIIEHLKEVGISNSYQRKVLNGIKRVYLWGREEGKIKGGLENITSGINVSRIEEKKPEILSFEQLCFLLDQAKKENNPWYPIWMVAIMTGCRNGELFALEWSDIDFDQNLITIAKSFNKKLNKNKSTKSGYFRTVPINQALRDLLIELRANSKDNFVLPRVKSWVVGLQARELRRFCLRIGIPSVKFHALRACFATHLLSKGVAIGQVQKIAGWADLETMMRYIRLAGIDVQGQTACLEKLAPKVEGEKVIQLNSFCGENRNLARDGFDQCSSINNTEHLA